MSQKLHPYLFRIVLGILAVIGLVVWSGCGSISLQARQNPKYQNAMRADQRLKQTNSVQNSTPDQRSASSHAANQRSTYVSNARLTSSASDPSVSPSTAPSTANVASDQVFELYYAQLTDKEKYVYDLVYEAFMAYQTTVEYPFVLEETNRPVWSLFNDHPEIFWASHEYSVTATGSVDGFGSTVLHLQYYEFDKSIDEVKQDIEREMDRWFPDVYQYKTEFERERYIHDQIIVNTTYQLNPDYRHSIYSVFMNRTAVCEGFARAFQYAMLKYGMNATYVDGQDGDVGHSWTQVFIQGNCYNVDITNGSTNPDADFGNTIKLPNYKKFNLTDAEIERLGYVRDSDIRDDEVAIPACGTREFSFEDTLGTEVLAEVYNNYFNIPPQHIVNRRSQHDANMKKAGYEAQGNQYRVYEIVTGQSLMQELYELDNAKNNAGYVNELWNSKFKNYKRHQNSCSYIQVTKSSYLMYFEERYKN